MKRIAVVALAGMLAVSSVGPALAQFSDITAIVASIGGSSFLKGAERASQASSVMIVRLSTLAGAEAAAGRLDYVRDLKSEDIEYLQSNLYLNPIAQTALRGAGVSLGQAVAVQSAGDASIVVYIDDL